MPKQTIKAGDHVEILTGKDRGKKGKVLQVFPRLSRVSIHGINLMKRHLRSKRSGDRGQVIEFAMPIHLSNVRLSTETGETEAKTEAKSASRKK